ncbi:MAG TPA: cysteine--tRNA ligase [Candidatus Saccharibacteria bacterium]|nr:cysteine--tRNA ligase [Candidatus Saccharibacteria bacterium]
MAGFKLFNTASKKVEDFTPHKADNVSFYSCGPTVYDYPHIGNWYTFIRYDQLNRALKLVGYKTTWVMNVTDVGHLVSDEDEGEDKLEKGAKREGSTAWDVAKKYTDYFTDALNRLNINTPDKLPKATDHIQEQIDLIKKLENNGHTYVIDDGVYFDTSTFSDYGKMAGLNIAEQKAGARVALNKQKRNPSDFALWKLSPKGEKRDMEWDSPWGKGFPGWHIECSAMSMKYLGETLDIHGGGVDHIPVHHTNEIAQSEGATGKPFSRFWFHSHFNLVDGKKMSKSLGNFFTLEDVEKKGFDPLAFRLLVLQSHYRTEAHFSWENLRAAQNRLNELRAWADLRHQPSTDSMSDELNEKWGKTLTDMKECLANDLDTPGALAALAKLVNFMSSVPIPRQNGSNTGTALAQIDEMLGLSLDNRPDISGDQKSLLKKRQEAKDDKDYATADKVREELESQGIAIRDTDNGQIWQRTRG